ncbi:MAG: hypothetical protein RIR70_70 [Pseudomonadota bacterium]
MPFATTDHFHYDQAGRLWRTNAGDGIDKIALCDLQGNTTPDTRSTVLFGKAFHQAFAVLPDTLNQVRGDANVDRPIPLAGEEKDSRLSHASTPQ